MNGRIFAFVPLLPLLALNAAVAVAQSDPAPALGRLFFTPEKRAALDRQRAENIEEARTVIADPSITVNGIVTRSSGPETAWINGSPQSSGTPGAIWSGRISRQTASVHLTPPGDASRQVKVGETLHRGTGSIETPLGDGQISVGRLPSGRPPSPRP